MTEKHDTDAARAIPHPASVAHFSRAAKTYHEEARIQRRAAEVAAELVRELPGSPRFTRMLELGCGTGAMTEAMLSVLESEAALTITDASDAMTAALHARIGSSLPADTVIHRVEMEAVGTDEVVRARAPFDLIALGSVLQWAEDPAAVLRDLKALTAPVGGTASISGSSPAVAPRLVFTAYLPGTLKEVRELSGNGLPFLTEDGWAQAALAAGWTIERQYAWEEVDLFPTAKHVLRHLSVTGVNGVKSAKSEKRDPEGEDREAPKPMTASRLAAFLRDYEERFATPGGVTLTWRPIAMVLR